MNSNNFKGILEAYSEVYAPQDVDEATAMAKRGYDEAPIRKKIAKSTGGGEAADRATALENQPTFGQRGVDPKARQNLARAQRGDFRQTTSSSPGLHGYGHQSDDPKVKAKQAARGAQRGVLTPAEKKQFNREEFDVFDTVLEYLCVEGYAETLEEAEWIMANELTSEDIEEIVEAFKQANLAKMKAKEAKHASDAFKQGTDDDGKYRSASRNRSMKMSGILGALERGEDPRADGYGGARAARGNPPEDHRAAFSKNPLNNPARPVKKPGV